MTIRLDELDWKPWPKDPTWVYADIDGRVRVAKTPTSRMGTIHIRELDEDGTFIGGPYSVTSEDEAVSLIERLLRER